MARSFGAGWDERHIDIRSLAVRGGQTTGTSIALIEPNGERHFLTNTEIFDTLYAEQVPEEWLRQARLAQPERPLPAEESG